MCTAGRFSGLIRCTHRIRMPLDHLIMRPSDLDQKLTSIRTKDVAIVTWYMPLANLQQVLHRRYEAEQFGELSLSVEDDLKSQFGLPECKKGGPLSSLGTEGVTKSVNNPPAEELNGGTTNENPVPLGFVTLVAGRNYPKKQSWLERHLDSAPHPILSLRVAVVDRVHWQRTAWMVQSICPSICWGRIPQKIYSINLDWKNSVRIDAEFDEAVGMYSAPFCLSVPGLNFHLALQDTGRTLLDPETPVVDGFCDNESALHRLSLPREVNMRGLGGSVYRQTLWCTPSLPNIAKVQQFQPGDLFRNCFGADPSTTSEIEFARPVAAWLVREVEETLVYTMEGEVEDENEPNSATTYGDRSLTERVQKKAMNRYNDFRHEVRTRVYSDLNGTERPR
ncbi:hypothetical protein TRVL_00203 [Trypanosoma vivax]|uniref:Uncharacterized protein n=1 Tax=Trypanosoma vivax (strain Y486) TaxID=1055687 RepID=G0TYC6_TRYVY|nr:hypothetical protein TRVL_00203 [Trypanosoma vivax]CCC48973.1 conserved hypothetical protein [Trypanosoma vivax Y486]